MLSWSLHSGGGGQRNSDHKPITKQTRLFQLVKSGIKKTKLAVGANLRQAIREGV